MDPLVELEHVSFSYQTHQVLSDVCLKIYPGEFIAIIGPNGGGKTTLLKLMMGFLKPTHGHIIAFATPPSSPSPYLTQSPSTKLPLHHNLAYVPQSVRFDREFPISVREVVLSGLLSQLPWYGYFNAKQRAAAQEALERVGLTPLAACAFGTLSGGQAQRVLIARALVSNPKLLLLDEPTASVDNQAEADLYRLLKELQGSMTIIMVTHDLHAAIDKVERIFCVQGNVFSLKPEEVCEHYAVGLYHPPLVQLPTHAPSSFSSH